MHEGRPVSVALARVNAPHASTVMTDEGSAIARAGGSTAPTAAVSDQGSAIVEFLGFGVLLMVPLVYLVITMGRLQAATYAVDGSAREAARAFVTASSDSAGAERARAAVRFGLTDQGFDVSQGSLQLECSADPCLTPGQSVVANVQVIVVLPGIPGFVDRAVGVHVTVRASQVETVDQFRPTA